LLASKQESNFASKMRKLDRVSSFFAFTANCTTFSYDNEDNEDNKGQGGRQHALMSTLAGWLAGNIAGHCDARLEFLVLVVSENFENCLSEITFWTV
jgi:hypothetical protein